jgi:protein-S-isoprenylcysteine O-methyltransferase Ste14
MKLKYAVNLHKGTTFFVVLGMMFYYQNFTLGPWLYLALHGTYGFMWLLKDRIFPDRQWEKEVSRGYGVFAFCALGLYWIAPFLLVSGTSTPSPEIVATSVFLVVFGTMIHFASDAQKYYTLMLKPGLITTGFFSKSRNTNYLGELMIYCGFALASCHWLGFAGIAAFFIVEFIPNMLRKDKSLSRYPEFDSYKKRTWLIFPKIY